MRKSFYDNFETRRGCHTIDPLRQHSLLAERILYRAFSDPMNENSGRDPLNFVASALPTIGPVAST